MLLILKTFDLELDSGATLTMPTQVVAMMLFDERGATFRQGIRAAAKALDDRYGLTEPGERTIDHAVFTAHGQQGCMTPNQYWVPGMFSPMPMMGKYFNYYGLDFLPPRELGRKCVERMVYEFFSENSGICRFHRKWAEAIVDEIISRTTTCCWTTKRTSSSWRARSTSRRAKAWCPGRANERSM